MGPRRDSDGRHELVTVMQSISLADELSLRAADAGATGDEIVCPGLAGEPQENLAARALASFRAATGWDAPAAASEHRQARSRRRGPRRRLCRRGGGAASGAGGVGAG